MQDEKTKCGWVGVDPLYVAYHDNEWGVPVYNDNVLFEFLVLEGAQAGLSWLTVLKKRENYRRVFAGFDPQKVALFDENDQARLLQDPGIIRNRLKVGAAIQNARMFLEIQREFGSFSAYQWQFVGGVPRQNKWKNISQVPAVTLEAEAFSKDLKARGFRFVGPTIMYAHMQAVGMVNDHTIDCFRHLEVAAISSAA